MNNSNWLKNFTPDSDSLSRVSDSELEKLQAEIYRLWSEKIDLLSPEQILAEFQRFFLDYQPGREDSQLQKSLDILVAANRKDTFIYTLKRCTYLLIYQWQKSKNYSLIVNLVDRLVIFNNNKSLIASRNNSLYRRKVIGWIINFTESKDYEEMIFFSLKYDKNRAKHWSYRYVYYLLIFQSINIDNPKEQRDAAKLMARNIKQEFKFNLAMYVSRSQMEIELNENDKNPTLLGKEVLHFIKSIAAKQEQFSYRNIANIFLKQTQNMSYINFKFALQKYLVFGLEEKKIAENIQNKLLSEFSSLYQNKNQEKIDNALFLRTCNKVFELFSIDSNRKPSDLFILLITQQSHFTLVLILLKLILISPNSRIHLETKIAEIIKYYMDSPEKQCKWLINFLEIFNITFAIYADQDVEYNLIKKKSNKANAQTKDPLDSYQIFLQYNNSKTTR
jgi:hypothetical protein